MRWTWDTAKNAVNRRKHGLGFETAVLVFDDPMALSRPDPYPEEERWQTVGMVAHHHIFIVHTWPETDDAGDAVGRIISARKATARERKAYEESGF